MMNATSLYVSTCRLVIQANAQEQSSWSDLYRLLPYLRQSLSCTVCDKLLIEPYTPADGTCQHHVCKSCRGGKKRLKPSCVWCKSYAGYVENVQLRILLQCYKKLCEYLASSVIYRNLTQIASGGGTTGLLEIVEEGAGFKDDYKSSSGLTKSAYSILPCVLSPNSTVNVQTQTLTLQLQHDKKPPAAPVPPDPITNPSESSEKSTSSANSVSTNSSDVSPAAAPVSPAPIIKRIKVRHPKQKAKRKGCRCGNATPTPGKLTCCGQRCPCYVEAKACTDCRCRGCRNPHTPAGKKLLPFVQADRAESVGECSDTSVASLAATDLNVPPYIIHASTSFYSNSPLSVEPVEQVPTTLLVDDEKSDSNSDVDIDA